MVQLMKTYENISAPLLRVSPILTQEAINKFSAELSEKASLIIANAELHPDLKLFEFRKIHKEVTGILQESIRVFGEEDRAMRWLERPNASLNEQTPLSLLKTPEGQEEVKALLQHIDYGMYS